MTSPKEIKLNTGASIPAVGLGTWQAAPGEVRKAVALALQSGYRAIDCALIYGNETEVGAGIKDSGLDRKDIFLTSKLWNTFHPNAVESLEQTLRDLDTDYLDLYLVHWPVRLVPNESHQLLPVNPDGTRSVDRDWDQAKTWAQMEDILASGKVKAIGVCNWSIPYLEKLQKTWKVVPAINQVENHPYLPQHDLKNYCDKLGIVLEAYSPLGSQGSPLVSDSVIVDIANKHSVSPATVLISYQVNRGIPVLPKSVTESRIISNLKVIELDDTDMEILNNLSTKEGKTKRFTTPKWGWDLGFDDWYGPKK